MLPRIQDRGQPMLNSSPLTETFIRGKYITFLNDFTWLPANFVEETISFFDMHPLSLLAYPYDAYAPCKIAGAGLFAFPHGDSSF